MNTVDKAEAWDAIAAKNARIAELEARVAVLEAAGWKAWNQACENHDKEPPLKYTAPYGGLVELRAALEPGKPALTEYERKVAQMKEDFPNGI